MPLLIRRINRAKWDLVDEETNDVSADAITNCLKTYNNDLSVWRIEDEKDLDNAILALITGCKQTKLSTLHYVIIDEEIISRNQLSLLETEGDTVVVNLKNTHRDIGHLTYQRLGKVKDIVLDCIRNDKSAFFSRKQLKDLIKKSLEKGDLTLDILNPELVENEKLDT